MPSAELYLGDCLDILPTLEDESVDTVITDPPYGLTANKKGGSGAASLNLDNPGGRSRITTGGGFMGKKWDAGVPGPEYWAECLRVAKPGAMLCAFGGTRTHHRLMCAIEDAGWEIRDVLMWIYGSGFPKSHNIGKAIDKAAGAERKVVGFDEHKAERFRRGLESQNGGWDRPWMHEPDAVERRGSITAPATDAAVLWDGYGTALKPAYEPIILAMKPLPGTFAQNALDYGVAGIWVDGCRVGTQARYNPPASNKGNGNSLNLSVVGMPQDAPGTNCKGRWPANLLLSHAPGCECVGVRKVKGTNIPGNGSANRLSGFAMGAKDVIHYASPDGTETIGDWRCVPGCPVLLLDQSSGERHNGGPPGIRRSASMLLQGGGNETITPDYTDTGGASRFFTRFHYSAKASRSERELGLLGHIPCLKCGQLDSVTHMNVKTGKEEKCRRNGHPTVKPLDVCRWLCRLTRTPTGGVVLDPFMGSGRIPMAAILEGRDTIGIELERPSFEIAQAAVRWAEEQVPEMVQGELEHA